MSSERVRFGLFEFDLSTSELRREGVLLRLPSQPAQVLACLVEHARQAVTREELIQEVWGPTPGLLKNLWLHVMQGSTDPCGSPSGGWRRRWGRRLTAAEPSAGLAARCSKPSRRRESPGKLRYRQCLRCRRGF